MGRALVSAKDARALKECAGAVLFFCSSLAAPVTGQHLSVNGGQWLT